MSLLRFNALLAAGRIDPADVALLRHQKRLRGRPSPYAVWAREPADFERYQSCQAPRHRGFFNLPFWAGFVVTPGNDTLFTGLYAAEYAGKVPADLIDPVSGDHPADDAEPADFYNCSMVTAFAAHAGRLTIDWGAGTRAWRQYAIGHDKEIIELTRHFAPPVFPRYAGFLETLDSLASLPADWITALRSARGVYLLTCPSTHEQYVGSATGDDGGFWGRWRDYVATGHGGNAALRSRDPADYHVSILEVAGSLAPPEAIVAMEQIWKAKLKSREMGLNRN